MSEEGQKRKSPPVLLRSALPPKPDMAGVYEYALHSYGGHWPRALSIFFAAADEREQIRIFLRQTRLSSFKSALAFFLAAVMRRDLTLRVWAIGNELPPGGRKLA
jgi:hypothetical protein